MRAPEASMSRPSKPGRKVSDGLALPCPSVRARSGSIGVGEVLDVRLATSIVLPRHLIGALLMRTQRSARKPGFIVSTTWTSHLTQDRSACGHSATRRLEFSRLALWERAGLGKNRSLIERYPICASGGVRLGSSSDRVAMPLGPGYLAHLESRGDLAGSTPTPAENKHECWPETEPHSGAFMRSTQAITTRDGARRSELFR